MRRTDREQAWALRGQGLAVGEIAERLGLPPGTVSALLRRRATFAPRRCRHCGAWFVPANGRQRYCTPAHRDQHKRGVPAVRACGLCGQLFTVRHGNQRYCTREHQLEHQRRHGPPRTIADWREHVETLEAELMRLQARLTGREAA
jgi:hypothetical protein